MTLANSYNIQLFILGAMVLLSFFFSLSETALTSISRAKVEDIVNKKRLGAGSLAWLKANPNIMLATILVGNNIVNVSASAIGTSLMLFYMASIGMGGVGVALSIAIGILTFVTLVFGEIIPKTVAIRDPERFALLVAPLVWVLAIVLYPVVQLLIILSTPFVYIFGGKMPRKGPFLTVEEIKILLSLGEKEGIIAEEEREMISSIFEFGRTVVREVMTPRPDMQCVDVSDPIDKAINLIIEGGHSRIPVYEGNLDNILGVVYAKDLLRCKASVECSSSIRDFLRTVLFIPEGKRIEHLLHEMQAARTHIAIVVDEYGGTAGVVSMEDIVEEIVGEIYDEFEKKVKAVEKIDELTTVIDARMNIADVNKLLATNFPEKEYDTLGGFIFGLLGKLPAVGDNLLYDDVRISVERIHKRRITRAKIVKLGKPEEPDVVGG